MNFLKKIIQQINIPGHCRRYDLSLWQCPQFLFLVMGIIVILSAIILYFIGLRYIADPRLVVLMILGITIILFIINPII